MKTISSFLFATLLLSSPLVAADPPSPRLTPEFMTVLRSGDARRLRQALDRGAPVNTRDSAGNSPLMWAAVYGDAACMRLLLSRGADVNATNAAGATPLMRAAFDADKVKLLLQRGADVNARSAMGNTALILAARPADSHDAVELLLSRGADVKATNIAGATALMSAVAGGDADSVRLLLKHGAAVNASPTFDVTGFVIGGGRSALMWAAFRGDTKIISRLIDAGADVNAEGTFGSPLSHAAWAEQTAAARLLLDRGATVDQVNHFDSFTALHWAASTEHSDTSLVKLLLQRGANPTLSGGDTVDGLVNSQTPVSLAQRRGETAILRALAPASTAKAAVLMNVSARPTPERIDATAARAAISRALLPLQKTALESKQSFLRHSSRQDCVSCHQQYLPMAAMGSARAHHVQTDSAVERELLEMIRAGDTKDPEFEWQPLMHPEPAHSKGYALFGFTLANVPASEFTDGLVHHLSVVQGKDGRWHNNLPRPPMQSCDVSATALAIHALQSYPLPGRKTEFAKRVDRARRWLWTVKAETHEERVFQLLGLAWSGESTKRLRPLAASLFAEQHNDGGWSQLRSLPGDAYATGEAVYALHTATNVRASDPRIQRGLHFLLSGQLEDGTWHVRRRAFPFQPTMNSGFPHGRDGWISAAATSWAVLALSVAEEAQMAVRQ
jgi:ankyrin repeat protein